MGNSLDHPLHHHELKAKKSRNVKATDRCVVCHGRFRSRKLYGCGRCTYFMHRLCAQLPEETEHSWHGHTLTLRDGGNNQFLCSICGGSGTGINYSCHQNCEFKLHPLCVFMPKIESHQHDHKHGALEPKINESFTCDICKTGGSKYLHYSCKCTYRAHPHCLTNESAGKQLAVYRPSKSRTMGKILKMIAKKVLWHSILPGGLGLTADAVSAKEDVEAVILGAKIVFQAAGILVSDGKYLKMKWGADLPGFSSRSQKKEKILKELIMVFSDHMALNK